MAELTNRKLIVLDEDCVACFHIITLIVVLLLNSFLNLWLFVDGKTIVIHVKFFWIISSSAVYQLVYEADSQFSSCTRSSVTTV